MKNSYSKAALASKPMLLGLVPARGAAVPRGQIGLGPVGEFAEEEQGLLLEGELAAGIGQDAHRRIGIGGVPAGEGDVVIELVVGIPAQHDVAETEAALQRGEEL